MGTFGNAPLMNRSGAISLSVSKLEMFLSFETEGDARRHIIENSKFRPQSQHAGSEVNAYSLMLQSNHQR